MRGLWSLFTTARNTTKAYPVRVLLLAVIVGFIGFVGTASKPSHTPQPIPIAVPDYLTDPGSQHIAALDPRGKAPLPAFRGRGTVSDLAKMRARGKLRVLRLKRHTVIHPGREPDPEFVSILEFANSFGLTAHWIEVETRRQLVSELKRGVGDLVIDEPPFNLLADPEISATLPLSSERYVIVVPTDFQQLVNHTGDLLGSRIAVAQSSPVWPLLSRLMAGYPDIQFQASADHLPAEQLLALLDNDEADAVLLPASLAYPLLATGSSYAVGFALTEDQPVAWRVRATSPELKSALDNHLKRSPLIAQSRLRYYGDLAEIDARKVLRVLMLPDRDNFFLDGGARAGFEYDLVTHFANQRGLRVDLRVAENARQMVQWLKDGHGDLIASRAALRYVANDPELAMTRAFNHLAATVVTRIDQAPSLRTPADLYGRRVLMPGDPSYRNIHEDLRSSGTIISAAPPFTAWQTLLDSLSSGHTDAVVVDSHRVKPLLAGRADIRAVFSLNRPQQYRWAVRNTDPELLSEVDRYLKRAFRSKFYNIVHRRYFERVSKRALADPNVNDTRISPYDPLIKEYATRYGFDWRLIAAQVYEESRFDSAAISEAGATGLMQVLPSTGYDMGFYNLGDPETGLHAGVRYLDTLRQQLEDALPIAERTWFSLAAYHAGFERMRRARALAERLGLDPNRWFDNVEKAMLVSAKTEYGQSCQCRRTVTYVREVRSRYYSYVRLAPALEMRALALH